MAKALKTAALIVGAVALVATGVGAVALGGLAGTLTVAGISTSTLFLVSGGLTVAASLLQKTPKVTASQTERLTASVDPRAFRKSVLGQTACPVEIRYEEWSGKDQEYCDWIVLHASHAMDGIEEIWFDTEMAWSATTGVVGKWVGYFSIPHIVLEGSPANAFTFGSGRWNAASARLTGCAYSHWRFKVTGNGKKAESPFSGGLPSRITVIGRGAKLYDPRRDSTVPGGNGPMRADDQSTWRYTTDDGVTIGENLPLQILRVVLGWRIRNPSTGELKLATGSGVPARRLNLATFIDAANLADELLNRSAGGTEPRYHGAGVISEGDDPKASLDMLCTGCCGRFRDTGGKLSLVIAHNDLAAAAIDDGLNDHDVVGPFTWDPDAALEATPNVVRGKYVDASANSLYQLIDYPEVRLPSPDGQDRFFPLDLGVVESSSQAQRIAKMVLQRKQYPREFSAPFDIRAWKYSVGDVVPFTFAALGFNRRIFRVKDQELGQGGVCNMTLTVETPVLYAWDKDDVAPVQAADVIVYDSRNNPLILAIADAGTTADWDGVTGIGKPADNATNGADPNSPFGPGGTVGEAVATLDQIVPLSEAVELIAKAQIDYDALQRQATRDGAQLHDAVLRGILESDRTRTVMRDAGITVDPATGRVFIAAVDQVSQRTSRVEIDLDATKTLIALSATRDYVNEKIAAAQLDPTGQAALDEVLLRLTKAEIRLAGNEASIALKADATVVTLLTGRVSSVRQDLDALAGVVSTKAEATVVDKLGTKVSAVEERLGALGDTAGYSIDIRQARYQADTAAGNALEAILASDDLGRRVMVAAAQVRQELYTRLVDGDAVEAAARTLLSVRLGTAEAAAAAETFSRVEQGKSLAQATSALDAKLGESIAATVRTLNQALATGDEANARSITQIGARLNNFGGVTLEAGFKALVERTGKIEARYTVAIDANGNLSGFQLIGSDAGPASFNLINTDLKMGTGRIIFRGGSYESRGGANFGSAGNLVEWFGPAAVPLGQETILNSRFCTANDGKVYYGGEDLSNGGFSANRVKQMLLTGSVGFAGSDTKQLSVAAALFPTGGKIRITGRLTAANARRDGGNGTEVSGFWIIRFYANYGSGPQLIVETECSITPGDADLYDGILALSGRLFDNPGPGGPVNLSATVQRGGDPNSGIASNWTGSAIVEWVNA